MLEVHPNMKTLNPGYDVGNVTIQDIDNSFVDEIRKCLEIDKKVVEKIKSQDDEKLLEILAELRAEADRRGLRKW